MLHVVCVVDEAQQFHLEFLLALVNLKQRILAPSCVLESIFPLSANIKSCICGAGWACGIA